MEKEIVFLRGKRVNLRPVLRSDIQLLLRWMNDPEVYRYLNTFFPAYELDEERWIEKVADEKEHHVQLAMVTVEGTHIGNMGLHRIHWKDRVAWSGAVIGEKEYWGRGFGTEAKMLLLNHAFNVMNLRKVTAAHFEFNDRSRESQAKCGYREEGRLKAHHYLDGRYWDEVLMSVFKEDWLPLWDAYRKEHLS